MLKILKLYSVVLNGILASPYRYDCYIRELRKEVSTITDELIARRGFTPTGVVDATPLNNNVMRNMTFTLCREEKKDPKPKPKENTGNEKPNKPEDGGNSNKPGEDNGSGDNQPPKPEDEKKCVVLNNSMGFYTTRFCEDPNTLYIKFCPPKTSGGKKGEDPTYILDLKYTPPGMDKVLLEEVKIISLFIGGRQFNDDIVVDITTEKSVVVFPPGTLTPEIVLTVIFNGDANSAVYVKRDENEQSNSKGSTESEKDAVVWDVTLGSTLFKNPGFYTSKGFAKEDGPDGRTEYLFQNYFKPPMSKCEQIMCFLKKIDDSTVSRSISDSDLLNIKLMCSSCNLKCNFKNKFCRRLKRPCRKWRAETIFHKYISYCITSIRTMIIFGTSKESSCAPIFEKCARRCEDRFEGCNVAMLIISSKFMYKISSRLLMAMEEHFGMLIDSNIFLNMHYKVAAMAYGSSKSDCKNFEKYIGTEAQLNGDMNDVNDNSQGEEVVEDDDDQQMSKNKKKGPSFFGKFKWLIIITITVTVVACAAYAFTF